MQMQKTKREGTIRKNAFIHSSIHKKYNNDTYRYQNTNGIF